MAHSSERGSVLAIAIPFVGLPQRKRAGPSSQCRYVEEMRVYASEYQDMITAEQRNSGPDEVTPVIAMRPALFSGASEALRRPLDELRSAFPIQTTPAAGNLTDTLLGDAPTAAFAGAFLGCLTTEFFSASGMVPAIASALATALLCGLLLVTRTTSLFVGAFFPALYGGTFAGMTPMAWLGDSASGYSAGALSVALSIVCGLVFFVVADLDSRSAAPIGKGIGGRLGAIAVVASFLFVELIRLLGADASRFHTIAAGAFDVQPWSAIHGFLACLLGIYGTLFVLRQQHDGSAPVRTFVASAAALFGLVVLQFGNPDDARAMDAFYAGCFLGTSTRDRLEGWFQPVSAALVLMALLLPVRALLPGFGGGLGLAAFIAVMLIVALSRATAGMTGDRLTGNRSFITVVASAMIAVFVMIGSISVMRPADEEPISAGMAALESTAALSDATSARLVVGKPAPGAADDPIPISISLINGAEDDLVVLNSLPSGSRITNGQPLATDGWQLLARDLVGAAIHPALGFVGRADITVELRRPDQTVIDCQELHLEWAGPAPRTTTDVAQPLTAGLSAGQLPDAGVDQEAILRAFLQFNSHAAPEIRSTTHPPRIAADKLTGRGRRAAASTGAHLLSGAPVGPPQPLVRRRVFSERQKPPSPKSSLPAAHQDRPS
jgi:hypothetical protein